MRGTPNSASSREIAWLAADCETPSWAAPREKLRSATTAQKSSTDFHCMTPRSRPETAPARDHTNDHGTPRSETTLRQLCATAHRQQKLRHSTHEQPHSSPARESSRRQAAPTHTRPAGTPCWGWAPGRMSRKPLAMSGKNKRLASHSRSLRDRLSADSAVHRLLGFREIVSLKRSPNPAVRLPRPARSDLWRPDVSQPDEPRWPPA